MERKKQQKTEPSVPVGTMPIANANIISNEPPEPELLRWRKTGGGTFRMGNGKIIKPNQVFRAAVEDIPKAFQHMIIPLDQLP